MLAALIAAPGLTVGVWTCVNEGFRRCGRAFFFECTSVHKYRIITKIAHLLLPSLESSVAVYWLEVSAALMMHEE